MKSTHIKLNENAEQYEAHGHIAAEDILLAAKEILANRVDRSIVFSNPQLVSDYLVTRFTGYEYEVFACLFLDTRHRFIKLDELFRGTIDGCAVYPREVVKAGLSYNAAAVVFAHNHPSGDPTPSQADKALTTRLKRALELVDIRVLDHFVVGGRSTISFAERGLI
jgi:DNA repair protein RadC